ncbi:hypothetical protein ABEB36_000189 [Hypothenemus hampei]|uniref:CCHC-type domain-containing protein n=1 Tax=Hypothenemus hampei TaxID=57062 RepID=A0ABD1FAG7_HYPHA
MATMQQKVFLLIHINNKLRGRTAQLISSRSPNSYPEIKQLLSLHFGDSRDLPSLIQDLQRLKELPNESPLTFYSRLQVLNAKLHANAQASLVETMALNTLLTGLEPRLGQLIRAGNPTSLLEAHTRISRELQLSYFENQKIAKSTTQKPVSQVSKSHPQKCSYCGRLGHSTLQCRQNPNNNQTPNQPQSSYVKTPQVANPNQPRPKFQRNFPQQRTHHVNLQEQQNECNLEDNYGQENTSDENNPSHYQEEPIEPPVEPDNSHENQNFIMDSTNHHPPDNSFETLTSQLQTLNLDDMNPNLNFPEQAFL